MLGSARRAYQKQQRLHLSPSVMLLFFTACASSCGEPSDSPTPTVSATPDVSPTPTTPSPTPEPLTCTGAVAPALREVLLDLQLSPYFLNLPSVESSASRMEHHPSALAGDAHAPAGDAHAHEANRQAPEVTRAAQVDAWAAQVNSIRTCWEQVVDAPDDAAVDALFGNAGSCEGFLSLLPSWTVEDQRLHALPALDVDRLLGHLEEALHPPEGGAGDRQAQARCDVDAALARVEAMRAHLTLPPEAEPALLPESPLFYRMRGDMAAVDPERTTWSIFFETVSYFNQSNSGATLAPYFQKPGSDLLRKVYCSDRDLCKRAGGPCVYGQEVPLSDLRTYVEGLGLAMPDKLDGTSEWVAYGRFGVEEACRPLPTHSDSNKPYHNFTLSRFYDYSEYNVYTDYLLGQINRAGVVDYVGMIALYYPDVEKQMLDTEAPATPFWQVQLVCRLPTLSAVLLQEVLPTTELSVYFENASFQKVNTTGTPEESRFDMCLSQALCERTGGPCEYGQEVPLAGTVDLDQEAGFLYPLSRLKDESMRGVACRDIPGVHAPLYLYQGMDQSFVNYVYEALRICMPGEYESWEIFVDSAFPDNGAEVITEPDVYNLKNMYNRTQGISFQPYIPWDWADRIKADAELVGYFPESSLAYGSPMLECMSRLLCDATCGPCKYGDEYIEAGRACRSLADVHAGVKNVQSGAPLDKVVFDKSVELLLQVANPVPNIYAPADLSRLQRLMDNLCPNIVSNPEECPPRDEAVDAEACDAGP
ncbi:MAG: hypothetical protein ACKO6N_08390 [Myxococcota bacterium]